eukprot:UN11359
MATFAEIFKETDDRCDILVSNAGIWTKQPFEDITEELYDKITGINQKGTVFSMKAVIPVMKKQKKERSY